MHVYREQRDEKSELLRFLIYHNCNIGSDQRFWYLTLRRREDDVEVKKLRKISLPPPPRTFTVMSDLLDNFGLSFWLCYHINMLTWQPKQKLTSRDYISN